MVDAVVLIQTGAAVVTALSAIGIVGFAYRGWQLLLEHERVLHGEDAVDDWNGIVETAQSNKQRSERNRECIETLCEEIPADD